MTWVGDVLAGIGALGKLLGGRPRVKVEIHGPIGLERPHPYDFTVTVRNMTTDPISITEAGVIIASSRGGWRLMATPLEGSRLKGRSAGRWHLSAEGLRNFIVGKGVYEARVRGFAQLATGKEVRSADMPVSYPYVLDD